MYYRRILPVSSGVYRPLEVHRYVMTTMGGFWPVIQKLPNGNLGVVTRDGDFHIGERGRLVFVTSPDGGESWSHASVISADGPDNRNPAFGVTTDGTLLAAFIKADKYVDGNYDTGKKEDRELYISRSEDSGATWSKGEPVDWRGHELKSDGGSPYFKMVTLPDGTVLLAYSSPAGGCLVRSSDRGATWTDPVMIGKGLGETALCYLGDGHLLAVMRGGALHQMESRDDGYTWSEPRQITDEWEFPGDVLKLQDGRLLLTYGRRVPPYGVQGMVSHDEGRTWDGEQRLFLVTDSSTTDCGYPSSVQRDDGTIVTVYYAWDTVAEFDKRRRTGVHGAALLYRPEDLP